MEVIGFIGSPGPLVIRMPINETMANAGVIAQAAVAGTGGGIELMDTAVDVVEVYGITTNAGTFAAGIVGGGVDPETTVGVVVNPDAIIRGKMTQGATEDTALTLQTPTVADATGDDLTLAGTACVIDGGGVWGYSGNNAGYVRETTDVGGGMTVAMPNAIATTDRYIFTNVFPGSIAMYPQVSTGAFTQFDVSSTTANNTATVAVLDLQARDITDDGRNNSFIVGTLCCHALAPGQLA